MAGAGSAAVGAGALVVLVASARRRTSGGRLGLRRGRRAVGARVVLAGAADRLRRPRHVGEPISLLQLRTAVAHGASLTQAFAGVAHGGGDWAAGAERVRSRVQAGAPLQEALDQWVEEDQDPAVALVADALAIAASSGGSLVRAIDVVIEAVRDRRALQREVRALASQARASAAVLVLMPMAFSVAVGVLDPRIRGFYLGSAAGPGCLAAGAVLDGLGLWWMLRLVRHVG